MSELKWWQSAVFYQIYPRSFADGNGDGIGDFVGINAKLDYLYELGIDAIWLSPHYPSPLVDGGYDITDFMAVAPEYGTLENFVAFLHNAHARNLRVVLDLVLNHTSDQHPWFLESRASRTNPKRNWYMWRDGKAGAPPNNWASIFGGSAWTYDPLTEQYYYHAFLKEQPDLNWRHPEVKQAMWDGVRFWLDLGVDGFRLDAIGTIFEHPDLPNQPFSATADAILDANALNRVEYEQLMQFQVRQPGLHELLQELRTLIDEYPGDRVLIGEDDDVDFHGSGDNELHLVFNFPLMQTERLTPDHVRTNQALRLAALPVGAWPCNTLGNHDAPRVWSRYGDARNDGPLARLHAALLLTLKGTPFLYNGEEIGMTTLELEQLSQVRDTSALHQYAILTNHFRMAPKDAFDQIVATTRDGCRSPFQWSSAPNAGFCPPGVAPWLPVNQNFRVGVNVDAQKNDPHSLLSFYRDLLQLRRSTPALIAGDYSPLLVDDSEILAFLREDAETGDRCLVALNFGDEAKTLNLKLDSAPTEVLFSSHQRAPSLNLDDSQLAPFGILIVRLL